jgi:hypothetical protein
VVKSANHEAPVYIFFSSPNNSYLYGPHISLSTLFSKTISLCFFLNVNKTKFHTRTQQQAKLYFFTFNSPHCQTANAVRICITKQPSQHRRKPKFRPKSAPPPDSLKKYSTFLNFFAL